MMMTGKTKTKLAIFAIVLQHFTVSSSSNNGEGERAQ